MATFSPPKKNTAFECYLALVSQANTKIVQVSPTMAAGDVKVSTDNGASSNITTLPVIGTNTRVLKVNLSAAEMNGDNVTVIFSDAAGAEWCDLVVNLQTAARQIDDLAYPATTGRSIVVDLQGLVDANTVKLGPTGTGTAQTAKDVGGAVPAVAAGASGGILISGSNAGTTTLGALTVTGATTHTGATVYTGNVSMADGLTVAAPSTLNRAGIAVTGNGSGAGLALTGGAAVTTTPAGDGLNITGGAASTGAGGLAGTGMEILGGAGAASANGAASAGRLHTGSRCATRRKRDV